MIGLWTLALCLAQAADPDVSAALEKLKKADRYAFKVEFVEEGATGRGRGSTIEGRYVKDQPTWLKSGELEVFRKGERLAIQKKNEWRLLELRDGDKVRGRMRSLRLPHEELADLTKQLVTLKKLDAKEGDQSVYLGELSEEASRAFLDANSEKKLEGPPAGTGRVWLSAAGDLAMVEIIVRVKGKAKNPSGVSMWITLSEIGSLKAEIPESAVRALEEK